MVYNTLREAIADKKCHFCGQQMKPYCKGFYTEYVIENDILITEDYKVSIDKESQPDYNDSLNYLIKINILGFECPEHLFRSDITIEHSDLYDVLSIYTAAEEILIFDTSQAYLVRSSTLTNKTSIQSKDKSLINKNFGKIEFDIMEEFDFFPKFSVDLIKFPPTIEELLKKIKMLLTFQ